MTFTLYSQQDPRWANQELGNSGLTLQYYGCLVTCLAMACSWFNIDETPGTLDTKLTQSGGYANGRYYRTGAISYVTPLKELDNLFSDLSQDGYNAMLPTIRSAVASNNQICIVQIDFVPNTSASDSHYVVVLGVEENGDLTIGDPWTGTKHLLSDYYGATVSKPSDTVLQVIVIEGQEVVIPPVDLPLPTEIVSKAVYEELNGKFIAVQSQNAQLTKQANDNLNMLLEANKSIETQKNQIVELQKQLTNSGYLITSEEFEIVKLYRQGKVFFDKKGFSWQKIYEGLGKFGIVYAVLAGVLHIVITFILSTFAPSLMDSYTQGLGTALNYVSTNSVWLLTIYQTLKKLYVK
jgi:Peptidase_C39 like family